MPISARNARIGGATLIAVLMVAGGYILPGLSFPETKAVNAELTDDILANYVSKDTDSDGLPDWQEVLFGTDSAVADTDGDGISDGEAVRQGLLTPTALASQVPSDPIGEEDIPGEAPAKGSITEQFSRAFFESYIEAGGGQPMTAEAQQELLARLLDDFNARVAGSVTSSYSSISVRSDPNVSVSAYARSVEDLFKADVIPAKDSDALFLMQKLIQEDDASAAPKLDRLARSYQAIASGLLITRVPPQLADEHLMLIRAFDSLGKSVDLAAGYQEDPIAVLGALAMYRPAASQLDSGMDGLAAEVIKLGEPADESIPGFLILYIARYPEL